MLINRRFRSLRRQRWYFLFLTFVVACSFHSTHGIIVLGRSFPEVLYYDIGGKPVFLPTRLIKDIGLPFKLSFKIENDGHELTRPGKLTIRWPREIYDNSGIREWLIYPTHYPSISGSTEVKCHFPAGYVNTLNLKVEEDSRQTDAFYRGSKHLLSSSKFLTYQHLFLRLDCDHRRVVCIEFSCDIPRLISKQAITVELEARFWNTTIHYDFSAFHVIYIRSDASFQFDRAGALTFVTAAESILFLEHEQRKHQHVNWLSMLLWILSGIIGSLLGMTVFGFRAQLSDALFGRSRADHNKQQPSQRKRQGKAMFKVEQERIL